MGPSEPAESEEIEKKNSRPLGYRKRIGATAGGTRSFGPEFTVERVGDETGQRRGRRQFREELIGFGHPATCKESIKKKKIIK